MTEHTSITARELRFERLLDAPVETVWRYLVEPDLRARWLMGGPTEPRVGGALGMTFDHANLSDGDVPTPERFAANVGKSWHETITRIEPPHLLAFTWNGGDAGEVTIELDAEGGRTRLVLTHAGLRGPADARNFGGGWHAHLAVLQTRLAGGTVPDFWALHRRSEVLAAASLEG
ncbi:MAG: SRPBCC family protein [Sphingomonas sp.]|jgi:uncharacterized protein YndB with AHSA1/START domain|uniref:SRPBCC family protein n=1 Tax=Sphingomonas sp. TaxID=28214 RepID=UPI0035668969